MVGEKIMTIEDKVYLVVKNRCEQPTNAYGIGAWDHHIKTVYELAKQYANDYGADQEIVSLASLLHDIASVTDVGYTEEHHIIGAKIAEEILIQENYPSKKIDLIKKCILNHRGSRLVDKTSNEEVCVADCDAMAHFYSIPSLLSMVYREKNLSIDEGSKFVLDKLERSYNKMSEKGKQLVKVQYEAAKSILK
ncbi:MAG: HD domain-containing protein [Firmicutes bacterium]|nr:HD domain-containing protein [Bacillota bacterium]